MHILAGYQYLSGIENSQSILAIHHPIILLYVLLEFNMTVGRIMLTYANNTNMAHLSRSALERRV